MECADAELSILLTDNPGIAELNKKHRDKDGPTDVLSFPMDDDEMIGDVVISVEMAREQAADYDATLDEELGRLVVHGVLHLFGHDHVNGGRQAAKMKRAEEGLMSSLREARII